MLRRLRRSCLVSCRGAVTISSTARSRSSTVAKAAPWQGSSARTRPSGSRRAAGWSAASPTCQCPGPVDNCEKGGGEPRTLPLPISSAVMKADLPSLAPPTRRANSILGAGACSSSSSSPAEYVDQVELTFSCCCRRRTGIIGRSRRARSWGRSSQTAGLTISLDHRSAVCCRRRRLLHGPLPAHHALPRDRLDDPAHRPQRKAIWSKLVHRRRSLLVPTNCSSSG